MNPHALPNFSSFCTDHKATWKVIKYPRGNPPLARIAIIGINQLLDDGWMCLIPLNIQGDFWYGVYVKIDKQDDPKSLTDCFTGGIDDLVLYSFRYFIRRRTIETCHFANCLSKAWPYLSLSTQNQIRKELDAVFEEDDEVRAKQASSIYFPLGMDCDREHWEQVRMVYMRTDSKV